MTLKESPSQTAGPYVHIGCVPNFAEIDGVFPTDLGVSVFGPNVSGTEIKIRGKVIDGQGAPVLDALIEIWQADAQGRYSTDPNGDGFGRVAGDQTTGVFEISTVLPGAVDTEQAPHITLWIVARGINTGLHTRIYFEGEASNENDPILKAAGERAETLVAKRDADGIYVFDIHLQGENETVFLDM